MYASLSELKARLGITSAAKDSILTDCLTVASAHIDRKCGRSFNTIAALAQPTTRTFAVSGYHLFTDDIANLDDLEVFYGEDEVTATPHRESYDRPYTRLDFDSVQPHGRLLSVTAHYGWPETPVEVDEAALLLAHRLYKRADTPAGVGGFDQTGSVFRLPWRDPDVELLLAPYRKVVIA